jgi:energy-coupling factor transport system substrate-specific component
VASSIVSPRSWSTRDIVVTAALAVATGISFVVFDWVWLVVSGAGGPFVGQALAGFWLLGGLLVPYIVRRPGSAIFGELVAALVESSFNPWGIEVLLAGLLEGLGAEIIFLVTGYRRFDAKTMALAGGFSSVFFFIVYSVWYNGWVVLGAAGPVFKLAPAILLAYLLLRTISGIVLAGWLGKGVGDALVPTGVLDGFAIAANRQQDV